MWEESNRQQKQRQMRGWLFGIWQSCVGAAPANCPRSTAQNVKFPLVYPVSSALRMHLGSEGLNLRSTEQAKRYC